MHALLVVTTPPYGSEGPYNALRLADALALQEGHVEVFLMGDAVHAAKSGQEPREAHASLEHLMRGVLERGVTVDCCGTCCRSRGLDEADLIEGVQVKTIHDLAASLAACDRSLSL